MMLKAYIKLRSFISLLHIYLFYEFASFLLLGKFKAYLILIWISFMLYILYLFISYDSQNDITYLITVDDM